MMPNQTVQEDYPTLDDLNREEVLRQVPLIVFLILLVIFGSIGNILVLYVYKSKYGPSSCRTFVLFLSTVDLFSAAIGIPLEILLLSHEYNFRFGSVCKLSMLVNSWPTLISGFVLLAISVDRYRKICHPFLWQITPRIAKYICILGVLVAFAFSWISPLTYGIRESEHPEYNVSVFECAVTHEMQGTAFPLVNSVLFAVLFVGALVSMAILYVFIGIEMKAFSERRAVLKSDYLSLRLKKLDHIPGQDGQNGKLLTAPTVKNDEEDINESTGSDVMFCTEYSEPKKNDRDEITAERSPNLPAKETIVNTDANNQVLPKSKTPMTSSLNTPTRKSWISNKMRSFRGRRTNNALTKSLSAPSSVKNVHLRNKYPKGDSSRRKAQKTATVMLRVTLAFIISYLPFLSLFLIRTCVSGFTESLGNAERAVYKFFLRSYYLNCAVNPVIYGMWDARFRQTVIKFCFRFRRRLDT